MQNGISSRAAACAVCGSRDVRTDAVEHDGWLALAECARCDHRWTRPLHEGPAPVRALARVGVRARPEVASAA
jgi:transcription elongation factor Elf1